MKTNKNSKFTYRVIETGPAQENCTILKCLETDECVIFDPGDDFNRIVKIIEKMNGDPVKIVNTHGHYDHVGAIEQLKDKYKKIKLYIHRAEEEYFLDPNKNLSLQGTGKSITIKPDFLLNENDVVTVGKLKFKTIHTPGHTKGSSCFLMDELLIAGDTIFAGSIGRSDLYGGNEKQLIKMIHSKIATLPEGTVIIPGHGRSTTVREEKMFNPFLY